MKIQSPIVTLFVGVLIAVVVVILSVRAHDAAQAPNSAAVPVVVAR
jgi:hypothetical protein